MMFAKTPAPPYYAVIFTNLRMPDEDPTYIQTADEMEQLASQQPGYLGMESVRGEDGFGITVSYWTTEAAIASWKAQADHRTAQRLGRETWYRAYELRIAYVERAYRFLR